MNVKKILLVVAVMVFCLASVSFAGTTTHEYDELNRLIRTTYPDGTVVDYTYDEAGNRLTVIKENNSAFTLTVQISADPETIQEGGTSTLSWTSINADTCEIDQGIGSVPFSGTTAVSPTETTTYTITATGPGGTATDNVTITVEPPPTVQISADPASIYEGQSSTLTWTSTDADSCSIDQGIGTVDLNGSTVVSPTETTTYTITATGAGGSTATDSVTVIVSTSPPPTVSISADPGSIEYGASSTLTWTSTYATSCNIDQGIGSVDPNGSTSVSPAETTTYTITATGPSGTATDSVIVTVTPPPPQTLTLRPNAAGDNTGISQQVPFSGAHYDKVDDVTADTTTFVCTMWGFGEYDLYAIPDHTTESGTINYIKVYYRVRANYSGCFARPVIKTGGTVYYGTLISPPTTWTTYNYTWTTNPKTGAAWTWNNIDDLQIGIELMGYSGYYLAYCTQVYVEVNYTPSDGE